MVKIYFVSDTKANYLFWLNELKLDDTKELYCPDTTLWTKSRSNKEVYLLREEQASIINLNE